MVAVESMSDCRNSCRNFVDVSSTNIWNSEDERRITDLTCKQAPFEVPAKAMPELNSGLRFVDETRDCSFKLTTPGRAAWT